MEGTAGQLPVQAATDFLLGRAVPGQGARQNTHPDAGKGGARHSTHPDVGKGAHPDARDHADQGAYTGDGEGARSDTHIGGRGGGRGGWVLNPVLVIPWDPSLGQPSGPAELPGFGLLDHDGTMGLLAAAAGNPSTRWWKDTKLTCACNLAPACRAHHQIQQAKGWAITQTAPGVLTWASPSGLTRTTTPSSYAA